MTSNNTNISVHQPRTVYMDITPERAAKWLEGNIRNRKIDHRWVDYLTDEILAGRWNTTHQGLAFDQNNTLVDGQHRLMAVLKSGCTIRSAVSYGLDKKAIDDIDGGNPRDDATRMSLTQNFGNEGITRYHTSALNDAIAGLTDKRKPAYHMRREAMEKHIDAVRFATAHISTKVKGVGVAYVRAVIIRAWYWLDRDDLATFCRVLSTGIPESPLDVGIIRLRDHLMTIGGQQNKVKRRETYAKVERVLITWMNGESRKIIRPVQKEYFPLPEETVA